MLRRGGLRMSFWHGTRLISFDLWTKAFGIGLSTKSSCWWFHQFLHQFDIYIKENPSRNRHNDSSMSTGFQISSTKLKRAFFTRKLSFPGALGTALGSALGLSWTSELLTGSAQWAVRPLQRNHNETMTAISCQLSRFPLSIPTIKSKHSKPESPHSSHFAFLCLDWE